MVDLNAAAAVTGWDSLTAVELTVIRTDVGTIPTEVLLDNSLAIVPELGGNQKSPVSRGVSQAVRGRARRVRQCIKTILYLISVTGLLVNSAYGSSNPIVDENNLPGTAAWVIPWGSAGSDVPGQIKGYASAVSINHGENIAFQVSVNPEQSYTIDIFRLGWYQGLGGRLMQHVGPLSGFTQPQCPTNATTGMIECHWSTVYTLATQTSWTTGVYLALLTNAQGYKNYIEFTVRDDSRVAALLYQQSVLTYAAYNDYPYDTSTGKSLYDFNSYGANTVSGSPRAVKVSFDRPYMSDGLGQAWGFTFLNFEYPFIRWMEMSGYDVTYATDVDTDSNGGRLRNYLGILSVGHDEYWTNGMYDAFIAARDSGVNLGFFGADGNSRQVRLEASSSGVPARVVVFYGYANIDPNSNVNLKTVDWRDPVLNRPEQTLIGTMYSSQVLWRPQYDGYVPFVVTNSSNWVYAGTGLRNGDSVPGIVGYEGDRLWSEFPAPFAVTGTYTLLSRSPFNNNAGGSDYSNATVYQAPSGAWVFATGTMGWSRALDDFSGWNLVDARIQRVTANVLNRFVSPLVNFSVTASPASQTKDPGSATSYSVTITPTSGFSGQVSLSVSGLPSGANASFSPNPATTFSTASVTTSPSTPAGTYTLTIGGVSGVLTHTTTVTLVVNQLPDFTLSASPPSQAISPGSATSYNVTISPLGGFSNQVTLSVSGLPNGANASFSPNPGTASSTLSVTTSAGTPIGTSTLTINGVSGSLMHATTVSLTLYPAGVKYDNAVSSDYQFGTTSITTPPLVIGSAANRAAMIMVTMGANNATGITAGLGGVSGALIAGTDTGTRSASIRTMIFCVANPPSGSQTARVSWTSGMNADVGVITVSGADQTTPCNNGTLVAEVVSGLTSSVMVTSNSGDLTASLGVTAGNWAASPTNQVLRWGLDGASIGGDTGPSTGITTHTWTDKWPAQAHSVSAASFKAAP